METELREMRDKFYRHLKNQGYSDAYSYSLANDYITMSRKVGIFPSPGEMEKYYNGMLERGISNARLGNTTKMFKHWCRFSDTEPPDVKPPRDNSRRITYLTEMEAKKLLYACDSIRDYALLCVLLYAGLRRAEVVKIRWEDIDFKERILTVKSTKTNSWSNCVLSEKAVKALEMWRVRYGTERVFAFNPDRVTRIVRKFAKAARLEKRVTPHVLRHTLATNLYNQSGDIMLVKEQLRHRDIKSTLIYTHLSTDEKKRKYDRFCPEF
ncbi:MAG TPA: site-specific integrase [Candidatus Methanofastidiosa archaeon]|nr:site-specific integrase [Candidatus Methanofastidiosa archaeon]